MLQTAPLGFAVNGGFGSAADLQVNPTNFLPWVSPYGQEPTFDRLKKLPDAAASLTSTIDQPCTHKLN
jgi:hypothetical protein